MRLAHLDMRTAEPPAVSEAHVGFGRDFDDEIPSEGAGAQLRGNIRKIVRPAGVVDGDDDRSRYAILASPARPGALTEWLHASDAHF